MKAGREPVLGNYNPDADSLESTGLIDASWATGINGFRAFIPESLLLVLLQIGTHQLHAYLAQNFSLDRSQ